MKGIQTPFSVSSVFVILVFGSFVTLHATGLNCWYVADGIYENPTNCSTFYKCSGGVSYLFNCSKPLLFNANLKVCDWPQNVDCQSQAMTTTLPVPTQNPLFDCYDKPSGVYPNPIDCSTFYKCSNGYTYRYHCPANLVFNPVLYFCDYRINVASCQGGSTGMPPSTHTTEQPPTTLPTSPPTTTTLPTTPPTSRPTTTLPTIPPTTLTTSSPTTTLPTTLPTTPPTSRPTTTPPTTLTTSSPTTSPPTTLPTTLSTTSPTSPPTTTPTSPATTIPTSPATRIPTTPTTIPTTPTPAIPTTPTPAIPTTAIPSTAIPTTPTATSDESNEIPPIILSPENPQTSEDTSSAESQEDSSETRIARSEHIWR